MWVSYPLVPPISLIQIAGLAVAVFSVLVTVSDPDAELSNLKCASRSPIPLTELSRAEPNDPFAVSETEYDILSEFDAHMTCSELPDVKLLLYARAIELALAVALVSRSCRTEIVIYRVLIVAPRVQTWRTSKVTLILRVVDPEFGMVTFHDAEFEFAPRESFHCPPDSVIDASNSHEAPLLLLTSTCMVRTSPVAGQLELFVKSTMYPFNVDGNVGEEKGPACTIENVVRGIVI